MGLIAGVGDFGLTELRETTVEKAADVNSDKIIVVTKTSEATSSATTATAAASIATTKTSEATSSATTASTAATTATAKAAQTATDSATAASASTIASQKAIEASADAATASAAAIIVIQNAEIASTAAIVAQNIADSIGDKMQFIQSVNSLKLYLSADQVVFDGSVWEKKSGDKQSNGGDFAGTIVRVSSSVYWERDVKDYILPEYFGAFVGNDDNTQMLQNAINAAVESNNSVKLKKKKGGLGLYKITQPLQINGSVNIFGDGPNYSGILCINTSGFIIEQGINNITISSLSIISQTRYTTTENDNVGIQVDGTISTHSYWHTYRDLFIDGFYCSIQCSHIWSSNFTNIVGCYTGIGIYALGQSINNFVSNCKFSGENTAESYGIKIGDGSIATEGWVISDCLVAFFEVGVHLFGVSNTIIRGCIIDFFTQRGIFLQSSSVAATMNCTVSENYLACSGPSGATGIWLLNNYSASISQNRGHSINNNQILYYEGNALSYGIYVSGSSEVRNIIGYNRIKASVYDIRVQVGENTSVFNNSLLGAGFYGDIPVDYYGNTGTLLSGPSSYFQSNGSKKVYYGTTSPSTGTYVVGDILYNTSPSASGYVGWICVTAGTPGTWKGFGVIQL